MFDKIKANWITSLAGLAAGGFAAFAATPNLDKMTAAQAGSALAAAFFTALLGLFAGDASKQQPPK